CHDDDCKRHSFPTLAALREAVPQRRIKEKALLENRQLLIARRLVLSERDSGALISYWLLRLTSA
ncbi:MAG: hypothetical protein J5I98_36510, partial [Phaeodactylibacter sp.]|nr:hypothetical protein [Phaeodactylibacter sp.]